MDGSKRETSQIKICIILCRCKLHRMAGVSTLCYRISPSLISPSELRLLFSRPWGESLSRTRLRGLLGGIYVSRLRLSGEGYRSIFASGCPPREPERFSFLRGERDAGLYESIIRDGLRSRSLRGGETDDRPRDGEDGGCEEGLTGDKVISPGSS